jgi:uncharacterized protein YdeI (YjbR/CyaY-like superfamily)
MTKSDLPILAFETSKELIDWLDKNHTDISGIWLRLFKKNSGVKTITYLEALEAALCYGWIDSQVKKYDDKSYVQKFTPRRSISIWSKINTERIKRLIKEGKMKPAGLAQVEQAKKDGRWDKAYDSPSNITLPEEFLKALEKDKKAQTFFKTLNKTNTYAIAWRLQTAKKPETKARRMTEILAMLAKGEKFH